ncbi:hypothetical protein [Streptomyces sp. GbtcB6]|uniref:hypothetical protein n=1 Tax=Streptomyces sp. GbtcB6 TaxID=2824751 RepID=UPI001C30419B|nr:hypothetical protein [Streptomyces sp. GbtcB6]
MGGTPVTPAPVFSSAGQVTFTAPAHTMAPSSCVDTVDIAIATFGGTSVPAGSPSQFSLYAAPTPDPPTGTD